MNFFSTLQCPYCNGRFRFEQTSTPSLGRGTFGILVCACSCFPVIDGIPIIQRAPVTRWEGVAPDVTAPENSQGVSIETLVDLLRSDRPLEALLECLVMPNLPKVLHSAPGWRLWHSGPIVRATRHARKTELLYRTLKHRDAISAREVLKFFYPESNEYGYGLGHYFLYRVCQPRHLAALAIAATMPVANKPILDIACGIGHFGHYFIARKERTPILGLDASFHQLWIAKHWIVPDGEFVCCDANSGLPFVDDCFSATICSDAYHYFARRDHLLNEIERCAPERMTLLTRVGNSAVMPNEGQECDLDGYLVEFQRHSPRIFDEDELLHCYLHEQDPFELQSQQPDHTRTKKWLSFAWNVPERNKRRTRAMDTIPPHAVGLPHINPIYSQHKLPRGRLRLEFKFPSIWYAYENHAMLSYQPRTIMLSKVPYGNPKTWPDHEMYQELIDCFALVGMPERF